MQRGSADLAPASRRTSDVGGQQPSPAKGAASPPLRLSEASPRAAPVLQLDNSMRQRSLQGTRNADAFDSWRATVRRKGFNPLRVQHLSAHQV